jgi:hypothetical protein
MAENRRVSVREALVPRKEKAVLTQGQVGNLPPRCRE